MQLWHSLSGEIHAIRSMEQLKLPLKLTWEVIETERELRFFLGGGTMMTPKGFIIFYRKFIFQLSAASSKNNLVINNQKLRLFIDGMPSVENSSQMNLLKCLQYLHRIRREDFSLSCIQGGFLLHWYLGTLRALKIIAGGDRLALACVQNNILMLMTFSRSNCVRNMIENNCYVFSYPFKGWIWAYKLIFS